MSTSGLCSVSNTKTGIFSVWLTSFMIDEHVTATMGLLYLTTVSHPHPCSNLKARLSLNLIPKRNTWLLWKVEVWEQMVKVIWNMGINMGVALLQSSRDDGLANTVRIWSELTQMSLALNRERPHSLHYIKLIGLWHWNIFCNPSFATDNLLFLSCCVNSE